MTDFGLAKRVAADGEPDAVGGRHGNPRVHGSRADIGPARDGDDLHGRSWSGAILYALMTGRAPFVGESMVETLEQVRGQTPEPPSRAIPGLRAIWKSSA